MKISSFFNKIKRNRKLHKQKTSLNENQISNKNSIVNVGLIKKIIYASIFFLIVILIYNYLPFVFSLINDQLLKAEGDNRVTSSIDNQRVNIVLIGVDKQGEYTFVDAVSLMVLDYQIKEMGIFAISPDIQINIPSINKRMEIRKVLNSSELKGNEMDGLVEGMEAFLGLKIDRYILIDVEGFDKLLAQYSDLSIKLDANLNDKNTQTLPLAQIANFSSGINNIDSRELLSIIASNENSLNDKMNRQNISLLAMFKSLNRIDNILNINNIWKEVVANIRTNMSKEEMFKMLYEISNLRDDQIKKGYIKISSLYAIPTTSVYKSYRVFSERLDKDIAQIFFNVNVFKEQARVEIFNGSGVRGLAANRTRWLRNIGINVVKVDNAAEVSEETIVYINNPEKYRATISEINKIFPNGYKAQEGQYYSRQVGDIVIIIGRNY